MAVSASAVSAALIREEGAKQLPVYYVSQAFQGAESRYPRIEKIAFALIVASRKLRQYFQANPILVMTDQPIKKSMNKLEAAGRMVNLVNLTSNTAPERRSRHKLWRTSSQSSHFPTKTALLTKLTYGRYRLMVR